jgi:hypothetical protein
MALAVLQSIVLTLGLNYGVHYASARMYDLYCVPHTWTEVIQSFATTGSPVCNFLVNTLHATQSNYGGAITTSFASVVSSRLKLTG